MTLALRATALALGLVAGTLPALAGPIEDRARAQDAATKAFLLGSWTFTVPDALGSRTIVLRFAEKSVALKVSGDSASIPGPLTATGVFYTVDSIDETNFYLSINADSLIGGGVHNLSRRADGTMLDEQHNIVWRRLD